MTDRIVVLGGGADQGGTADVDVLEAGGEIGTLGHRRLEGIEVDGEQVDGRDPVLVHGRLVRGIAPDGEETAVDGRMEGLDAAVHDFRKAGVARHLGHRDTGVAEGLRRTAGRQDLDVLPGEKTAELDQAGFVRNGNEGAANPRGHGRTPSTENGNHERPRV